MRRTLPAALSLAVLLPVAAPGSAQTHKVARPEQVVRAVGVYEWTGDLKKPDASRLIPVAVFIDGALQDAAVYLPRPIPFALTPGNEYELEQSGLARGTLDLAYATHLQTADSAYEDGWFGYGSYKAPPAPKKDPVLQASKNPAVLTSSKDDSHPRLGSKGDPSPSPQTADDPDALKKSSAGSPADDPDRPTMHRRGDSPTPSPDSSTTSSPDSTPANDPDRPTLRRRSPEDAKKSKHASDDVATVTGTGSLNDDPDRPKLQHGARSSANDTDIPKLLGLPKNLRQMVAVSDASNRPPHDFARPWQDEKEHAAVLAKMRDLARAQLKTYGADPLAPQNTVAPPGGTGAAAQRRSSRTTARPAAKHTSKPTVASPETALLDEDLKAYTLSYGGAATYVYTAHTAGTGPDLRYATIVAQADVNGDLIPAVRSATDETHLDRTPRMRLVDVVDAEASNRASLLFELRAAASRQFALYRVIGSRAEATFTTGSTQ